MALTPPRTPNNHQSNIIKIRKLMLLLQVKGRWGSRSQHKWERQILFLNSTCFYRLQLVHPPPTAKKTPLKIDSLFHDPKGKHYVPIYTLQRRRSQQKTLAEFEIGKPEGQIWTRVSFLSRSLGSLKLVHHELMTAFAAASCICVQRLLSAVLADP